MRQSVGMSAQLNIIVIFIVIVFALLAASLSYYKAYKISNVVIKSLEKYEGYNDLSINQINKDIRSLGYNRRTAPCESGVNDGIEGYCISYESSGKDGYRYKVTTYMYLDLPIIEILQIPVNKYTNTISCFKDNCE